jgi:uncharacterized protein YbjT (DUF2867 family)
MMKVFIVGIAGRTGFRLAELLAKRGVEVAGLAREPVQIDRLERSGIGAMLGDIAIMDSETLGELFEASDVVVFTAGAGESDAMMDAVDGNGVTKTIAAARASGLTRVYLVSAFPEAGRGGQVDASFEHYIEVKKRSEVELAESGLDWVILRPSVLVDTVGKGKIALAPAQFHTTVSRDDVAATLAALIHEPIINHVILELTHGSTPIDAAVSWVAGLQTR